MSRKIFVGVDIQNDFADPKGSLYAKSEGVPERIQQYLSLNKGKFDLVIFTADWHPEEHVSFASTHSAKPYEYCEQAKQVVWPDHCVAGSWGAQFHESIDLNNINIVVNKGQNPNIDSYSGVKDNDGTRLTCLSDLIRTQDTEIIVAGYCFDFCVAATAKDLVPYVYPGFVSVIKELSPSVFPQNDAEITKQLEKAGVKVIDKAF